MTDRQQADRDAILTGTGFLVHGKRVAPADVQIIKGSNPTTHADILAALQRIGDAHLKAYGVQIGAETAHNIIQEMKALKP